MTRGNHFHVSFHCLGREAEHTTDSSDVGASDEQQIYKGVLRKPETQLLFYSGVLSPLQQYVSDFSIFRQAFEYKSAMVRSFG